MVSRKKIIKIITGLDSVILRRRKTDSRTGEILRSFLTQWLRRLSQVRFIRLSGAGVIRCRWLVLRYIFSRMKHTYKYTNISLSSREAERRSDLLGNDESRRLLLRQPADSNDNDLLKLTHASIIVVVIILLHFYPCLTGEFLPVGQAGKRC